jgi:hypothetical protein
MKTYKVTIRMTVTKTYEVEAEDEQEARDDASVNASPQHEAGVPEDYDQEILEVEEVKE